MDKPIKNIFYWDRFRILHIGLDLYKGETSPFPITKYKMYNSLLLKRFSNNGVLRLWYRSHYFRLFDYINILIAICDDEDINKKIEYY